MILMPLAGTFVEPLDVVKSVKSVRSSRRSIPRSASPRKSMISGTPRRSLAPLSPSKNSVNTTPSRVSLPPNRQLDFSASVAQENRGISPHKTLWDPSKDTFSYKKGKNKRPFDLSGLSDGEEDTRNIKRKVASNADLESADRVPSDDAAAAVEPSFADAEPGDDSIEQSIEQEDQYVVADPSSLFEAEPIPEPSEIATYAEDSPLEASLSSPRIYDGPIRGNGARGERDDREGTETHEEDDRPNNTKTGRRGRPKKASSKQKGTSRPKPTLQTQTRATSTQPRSVRAGSSGPGSGRSYFVSRSETPATDDGVYRTRSGRTSIKPLAGWRGEKAIYGQRIDRETPAALTDIIRTEEIQMPPPPRRKARRVRAPSELEQIEEEPEEEPLNRLPQDLEPWETETGIRYGVVMGWDQEAQKYDEERDEETGKSGHTWHRQLLRADLQRNRTRLRRRRNRAERDRRRGIPAREDALPPLLRLRPRPPPSAERQTSQELAQDADGLLRLPWPREGEHRQRGLLRRHRRALARPERYVPLTLFFFSFRSCERLELMM